MVFNPVQVLILLPAGVTMPDLSKPDAGAHVVGSYVTGEAVKISYAIGTNSQTLHVRVAEGGKLREDVYALRHINFSIIH